MNRIKDTKRQNENIFIIRKSKEILRNYRKKVNKKYINNLINQNF